MEIPVKFEQAFLEDAVFLSIKSHEDRGDSALVRSFNTQKDLLYEKKADEKAFREFYENQFKRLGLGAVFESVLSEHAFFHDSRMRVFVRRVFNRKHEGGELYVDGGFKTVLLNIQAGRFLDPTWLKNFLRRELLRVSDMLDPGFDYSPQAPLGGVNDAENDLIREIFSALWNRYIHSRLDGPAFFESKRFTQGQLIEMAKDERASNDLKEGRLICPLCGFPSFDKVDERSCRQCFEMIQAQEVPHGGRR